MIRPSIPADCRPVAGPIIRAINQETANARGPHFPESDFLLACHRMLAGAWYAFCKWVFHARTKDGTFLNFPNLGVRRMSLKGGVRRMPKFISRRWTEDDIAKLKDMAQKYPIAQIELVPIV
jgi:hypothetical protein